MRSDAINLPLCLETRGQNTPDETGYDGNLFPHTNKKKIPSPSVHVPHEIKRSNSRMQSKSSGILCYVVVYVGFSTDVSKNSISFTFRIKHSLYPDGYSITIFRKVWNSLTTHSNIPEDFTCRQHY